MNSGGTKIMDTQELIEKLQRNIADWEEQARLWEGLGNSALAESCRTKAGQWAEVIKLLNRS